VPPLESRCTFLTVTNDQRIIDWLTLALTPGLGATGCRQLAAHFGTPRQVLAASRQELSQIPGLRKSALAAIGNERWSQMAAATLQRARNNNQRLICWEDPDYPPLLRTIHDPPPILYVRGSVELLATPSLAVVGARAASSYGRQMAARFAGDLTRRGLTIISGMALGIDTAAHNGALAAGGRTVAVLGCGLDTVYPAQNRRLYEEIAATGTLVSEYPPTTPPDGFRFPARNRIISGLALGVLVVEAASRSGSLITAHLALEQGREVFAMPGRVDSGKSEGSHRLLQDGAKLVHNVADILEELPSASHRPTDSEQDDNADEGMTAGNLDPIAQAVLAALDVYPQSIDTIIAISGLPARQVTEKLLLLELQNLSEVLPGGQYRKK